MTGCMLYGIVINTRESSLAEEMRRLSLKELKNPSIVVSRKNYTLDLYEDTLLVKSYHPVFGSNSRAKQVADDMATPFGEYVICELDSSNIYYKFYKINYPNLDDLRSAFHHSIISQREYNEIRYLADINQAPRADSKLGGNIGIHGIGRLNFLLKNLPFVFNWTDGSIAVSNESLDELSPYLYKGTRVVIKE